MKKYFSTVLFLSMGLAGCGGGATGDSGDPINSEVLPKRLTDRNAPNLLSGKNPNFVSLAGYTNAEKHRFSKDSHSKDASGSFELVAHDWRNALVSPEFTVEKGKKYLLSAYVKMIFKEGEKHGQNISIDLAPDAISGSAGIDWNVSKSNQWQEIILTFIPLKTGSISWRAFTTTRAFSTDIEKYREIEVEGRQAISLYRPKAVEIDGSNLKRVARVFLDDVKIIEIKNEVTPRESVADKSFFSSDFIRVDKLGNFSVKKNGKWTSIIPKLISRGSVDDAEYFKSQLKEYKNHGFNGVIGMYDRSHVIKAFDAGLEYLVGMGASSNTQPNGKEGPYSSVVGDEITRMKDMLSYVKSKGKPYAFLFHYLDNENEKLQEYTFKKIWADYINANDKDGSGRRARPIFYLNGQFGVARMYNKHLMDMTGAYVGMGSAGSPAEGAPKQTLGIIGVTQGEHAPANVIQLQTYMGDKFIPSLWFGIIQGGKVISVWRDGNGDGREFSDPKPFQQEVWATDIKRIFKELDTIAPIIKRPHWTTWKANFAGSEYVNVGTRDYQNFSYLIISNHSDNDEIITINFEGIKPKSVKSILGTPFESKVNNGQVDITIGNGNAGYLVLKLEK
jgi:hypothetical protein